jgi:hypothetical protein
MTSNELIKKYEEELLFCDERIRNNIMLEDYQVAQNWKLHKKAIREFITDLKKLLV